MLSVVSSFLAPSPSLLRYPPTLVILLLPSFAFSVSLTLLPATSNSELRTDSLDAAMAPMQISYHSTSYMPSITMSDPPIHSVVVLEKGWDVVSRRSFHQWYPFTFRYKFRVRSIQVTFILVFFASHLPLFLILIPSSLRVKTRRAAVTSFGGDSFNESFIGVSPHLRLLVPRCIITTKKISAVDHVRRGLKPCRSRSRPFYNGISISSIIRIALSLFPDYVLFSSTMPSALVLPSSLYQLNNR